MKLFAYISLLLVPIMAMATGLQVVVDHFTANYQGTDMHIEWALPSEDGVVQYEISRKRGEETQFTKLTTVTPNNSGTYTYVDESLFKSQGQNPALTYRLMVKTTTGSNSFYVNVSNSPTAVQRSWGSIKAMFK